MVLGPRLDMRQSQSLVMTPQLQQAIKLLALSNLELVDYVEQELEQNPLLERAEEPGREQDGLGGPDGAGGDGDIWDGEKSDSDGDLKAVDLDDPTKDAESRSDNMDVEVDNDWGSDGPSEHDMANVGAGETAFSDWGSGGSFDGAMPNMEETLSGKTSLRDHLNEQVAMSLFDPIDRMIGVQLIDLLNDQGYLAGEVDQVSDLLGCPLEKVEDVLGILQTFDPPGIFARDLAECLALQLRERDRLDPAMQAMLDNLDLLAKRDLDGLMKICGVDSEDIADMVTEIRELNPKPAQEFDDVISEPVVPDVIMRGQQGGEWIIELNAATLPRVLVNNSYFAKVSKETNSKTDRQYINECHQSANWLVKSLHQRATTILKVASEIVRQQDAFFARGVQHMRPLILRDIADVIEMHESTVSRVTSNKYIATPRGIFELKYFFSASIASSSGGETHSAESVRDRIKELIEAESSDKILSDDKIVNILETQGVDIARRTVAKYRESLGIPSSVQRRREKKSFL